MTSRKRVFAAVLSVAALGLTGVAASPAFASSDPELVPVCSEENKHEPLCLSNGGLNEEGIKARVRVEDVLCVRVDVLSDQHGVEDRSIAETVDARVFVPCPSNRVPSFKNCDEAHAAGASNIPRSDPRYRSYLDSDHDGVACEWTVTPPVAPKAPAEEAPAPVIVESDLPVTG